MEEVIRKEKIFIDYLKKVRNRKRNQYKKEEYEQILILILIFCKEKWFKILIYINICEKYKLLFCNKKENDEIGNKYEELIDNHINLNNQLKIKKKS